MVQVIQLRNKPSTERVRRPGAAQRLLLPCGGKVPLGGGHGLVGREALQSGLRAAGTGQDIAAFCPRGSPAKWDSQGSVLQGQRRGRAQLGTRHRAGADPYPTRVPSPTSLIFSLRGSNSPANSKFRLVPPSPASAGDHPPASRPGPCHSVWLLPREHRSHSFLPTQTPQLGRTRPQATKAPQGALQPCTPLSAGSPITLTTSSSPRRGPASAVRSVCDNLLLSASHAAKPTGQGHTCSVHNSLPTHDKLTDVFILIFRIPGASQ